MLKVNDRIEIPDTELKFTFSRSGGPGGQNVNKVESKVTLHWNFEISSALPGDVRQRFLARFGSRVTKDGFVVIVSQVHRDQPQNKADCLQKLSEMVLAVSVAPRRRKATKPTKGSQKRRLTEKKQRSERKASRGRIRDD